MKTFRDHIPKSLLPPLALPPQEGTDAGVGRKVIQDFTEREDEFAQLYTLKGVVMKSLNAGVDILYATRKSDDREVVVKVRSKATSFKTDREQQCWRRTVEVQLNLPKKARVCEFFEAMETKDKYYVVMEKVDGQDLFEQMAQERPTHADAREITGQILAALAGLHGCGRIHKDVKPENVMVDMNTSKRTPAEHPASSAAPRATAAARGGALRRAAGSAPSATLIDFDTAACWMPGAPPAKDVLGTDHYIAPEAYSGEYSPASDVYCVGVMMYRMLTGRFPLPSETFDDQPGENYVGSTAMRRVQQRVQSERIDFGRPPLDRCAAAADLCSKLLAVDPADRPSAEGALAHAWFALPPEALESSRRPAPRAAGPGA